MSERGAERLARLVRQRRASPGRIDLEPVSAYEVLTRQKVEELEREVRSVRRRIDALLFAVLAAIAAELVTRLIGG